eukprot:5718746-Heterocapsa_arctica.AAC.1
MVSPWSRDAATAAATARMLVSESERSRIKPFCRPISVSQSRKLLTAFLSVGPLHPTFIANPYPFFF